MSEYTIEYTHDYDRRLRTFSRFLNLVLWLAYLGILGDLVFPNFTFGLPPGHLDWSIWPLSVFAVWATWHFVTGPLINTLSSYLYITRELKTPVSWSDARNLRWLFVVNFQGTWYPLKHIRRLPKEQRREALFAQAQQVTWKYGRPTGFL
jgi:hypothetical protein